MSAPSVWVPNDIATKAELMINSSSGETVREGVELLLSNDLSVGGIVLTPAPGRIDAGTILAKGLANIAKYPHQALGVPIGAQTMEIKKAYKKMALRYHPDKNPVGTPIFQAIKTAFDKLADPSERSKAEHAAKRQPAASTATNSRPPPPPPSNPSQPFPKAPGGNNQQQAKQGNPTSAASGAPGNSYQKPPNFPNQSKPQQQQQQQQQQSSRPTGGPQTSSSSQHQSAGGQGAGAGAGAGSRKDDAYREWARKEDEARRHREEILRKAYYDQNKTDAEKIKKHEDERKARRATFDEAGKVGGSSTSSKAPTATPDERARAAAAASGNSNAGNSSNPAGPGVFKSFRPGVYPGAGNNSSEARQQQPQPQPQQSKQMPTGAQNPYVGKTFTTDAHGNVRMMGGQVPNAANGLNHHNSHHYNNASNSSANPSQASSTAHSYPAQQPSSHAGKSSSSSSTDASSSYTKPTQHATSNTSGAPKSSGPTVSSDGVPLFSNKALVPRPFQLKCSLLGATMVDLEWKLVRPVGVSRPIPVSTYAIELSWRDRALGVHAYNWESAKQLITGSTCRKKNLNPGANYDFRIRAVEELAGGMLGGRGEWSEMLSVTTKRESPSANDAKQQPQQSQPQQAQPQQAQPQAQRAAQPKQQPHQSQQPEHATKQQPAQSSSYQYSSKPQSQDAPKAKPKQPKEELFTDDDESDVQDGDDDDDEDVVEEVDEDINLADIREKIHQEFEHNMKTPRDGQMKHAWKQSPENTSQPNTKQSSSSSGSVAGKGVSLDDSFEEEDTGEEHWRPNRARAKAKAATATATATTAGTFSTNTSKPTATATDSAATSTPPRKPTLKSVDIWHELFDDAGNAYYYNEATGDSKWEAPEWVEEVDPNSGASYYVKLNTYGAQPLHSTWSKPHQFAQLVRQAGAFATDAATADGDNSFDDGEESDYHPGPQRSSTIIEDDDEDLDDYGEIVDEDDDVDHYSDDAQEVAEEVEEDD